MRLVGRTQLKRELYEGFLWIKVNAQWDLREGRERDSRDMHLYKGLEVTGTHKARFSKQLMCVFVCVGVSVIVGVVWCSLRTGLSDVRGEV